MSGGTRHYDFSVELVKRGHDVTIIASSFHYSKFTDFKEYGKNKYLLENVDGVNFVWIKTPSYNGNGFGRVINMITYAIRVLKYIPEIKHIRPDIVVGSSVHLFAVFSAYKLSRKYRTPFIMEVRDIWPQTLIDMGINKYHPFIILLSYLEKYLYKKADKIISNLPYAFDHIGKFVLKDKFVWISNGVDLSTIKYITKEKSEKFTISYTGAIGVANNLGILLDVANRLKYNKDILFRIIGDGAEKDKLARLIKDNNLFNVSLENSVAKKNVTNILQESDILFFNLKDSPIFKYGISSNKLYDYMASGRVIIFSSNAKNNPINEANAGYSILPDNPDELERTIIEIYNLSQEKRNELGLKIRNHVEENYSIEVLVDKFEMVLVNEINKYKINNE